jgi:hypothetical protein
MGFRSHAKKNGWTVNPFQRSTHNKTEKEVDCAISVDITKTGGQMWILQNGLAYLEYYTQLSCHWILVAYLIGGILLCHIFYFAECSKVVECICVFPLKVNSPNRFLPIFSVRLCQPGDSR